MELGIYTCGSALHDSEVMMMGKITLAEHFYRITILDRWSIKLMLVDWREGGSAEGGEGGFARLILLFNLHYQTTRNNKNVEL